MVENIVVFLIVASAVGALAYRLWQSFHGKNSCNCSDSSDCSDCPSCHCAHK